MRKALGVMAAVGLFSPLADRAQAQESRAALESIAKTMGGTTVKSIQYMGTGMLYQAGQAEPPGASWPRFNVTSYTRTVNYETATLRDEVVRTQAEDPPRGGGVQPVRGEARQILLVSGDHAWNVAGETATPTPIGLAERQLQLWSTPHGVIKGALANNGRVQ